MSTENAVPSRQHDPWNKGLLIGQKRPLEPKDVWTIRVRLEMEGHRRDLAMFDLAIDSKLRGCDLVRLRIDDVCAGGRVRDRAAVIEKKGDREKDRLPGTVRDHRANPQRDRRVAGRPRRPQGPICVPEPFPGAAASLDAKVRP